MPASSIPASEAIALASLVSAIALARGRASSQIEPCTASALRRSAACFAGAKLRAQTVRAPAKAAETSIASALPVLKAACAAGASRPGRGRPAATRT